jgi:GTP 3',8-cyclase
VNVALPVLQDRFGRALHYLRLSITDRCNFRCAYCLPGGCPRSAAAPLTVEEISRLVGAFASVGFWKVRVTGGEPTMRRDVREVVERIAATPGVRRVGLTTNGYRLAAIAADLRRAGLGSLNVSVDSLDEGRFARVTGCDRLKAVVQGIESAVEVGFPSIKLNAVLLRGLDDDAELDRFLAWTRRSPVTVRFIELMQTAENAAFFAANHLSAAAIRRHLELRGWKPLPRDPSDGPAATFGRADHVGRVGLIAPYGSGFCASCNRLRVSSTGDLRPCLFGEEAIPLRHLLQDSDRQHELVQLIRRAAFVKPMSHALGEGRCGAVRNLAAIGG